MSNTIKSVSGVNDDGSTWTLSIGDRVHIDADAADPDSADDGRISGFKSEGVAVVYWDSGVETPADVSRLTSL